MNRSLSWRQVIDLLMLAALWGASFLFMRLGAGDFGAVPLSALRVAFASLALLPLALRDSQPSAWRTHLPALALVGLVNSAIPFVAYGFALQWITGGLAAIFNASTPLWGALIAWLWLNDRPGPSRLAGLALGFAGVVWLLADKAALRGAGDTAGTSWAAWAALACVLATIGYGIGANATQRFLKGVPPMAVAAGSQIAATAWLLVPAWWLWPATSPSWRAWLAVLALGVLCTGLAYGLYFRLIAQIGPARAMTVTYLIPLFAMGWGGVFLGEEVSPVMLAAGGVILLGTALAAGLWSPGRRAAPAAQRR